MTRIMTVIACLVPLALIPAAAGAEETRDAPPPGVETYPAAEKGADLARIWCSACHVTGTGEPEQGLDAAPPFATLAPAVNANPDHYRTFLTKPHGAMREITLSRDEIDAVLAYISSLDSAAP